MAKEIKTADVSVAAQSKADGKRLCRSLIGDCVASLPNGDEVVFVDGVARVTKEQAEYLTDPRRFAFDDSAEG